MASRRIDARTDYRTEALVCAARTCATVLADLLALHPNAAELKRQAAAHSGRSLGKLLWQELVDDERACVGSRGAYYIEPADGTASQYWYRRSRLCGWKLRREASEGLPSPWPDVLGLNSDAARRLCVAIGAEMIARGLAGQPPAAVLPQLGPVGPDVAAAVVEKLRVSRYQTPLAIADRWRETYTQFARGTSGDRIPALLGRSLLATLFRRVPDAARAAAVAASRSKLPEALVEDRCLEPATPEELAIAQSLLRVMTQSESTRPPADAPEETS